MKLNHSMKKDTIIPTSCLWNLLTVCKRIKPKLWLWQDGWGLSSASSLLQMEASPQQGRVGGGLWTNHGAAQYSKETQDLLRCEMTHLCVCVNVCLHVHVVKSVWRLSDFRSSAQWWCRSQSSTTSRENGSNKAWKVSRHIWGFFWSYNRHQKKKKFNFHITFLCPPQTDQLHPWPLTPPRQLLPISLKGTGNACQTNLRDARPSPAALGTATSERSSALVLRVWSSSCSLVPAISHLRSLSHLLFLFCVSP